METDENRGWKVGDRISHKSTSMWRDEEGPREDWSLVEGRITRVEEHVAYWVLERVVKVHKMCAGTDIYQVVPTSGGFAIGMKIPWINRIGPRVEMAPWVREHGAEYAVPEQITSHPDLEDASWHNDQCPSFSLLNGAYTLWVDHPDRDQREWEGPRFVVYDSEEDGQLYAGDDLDKALEVVNGLIKQNPPTDRDRPMRDFETRVMDCLRQNLFTQDELGGMQEALNGYREYRAANTYQGDPIGREGDSE